MSAPPLTLFRCPPLSAWMLKRQCETNRAKVAKAKTTKANTIKAITEESIEALGLEACRQCPGVEVLARKRGVPRPRPVTSLASPAPAGPRERPRVVTPRGHQADEPTRPRFSADLRAQARSARSAGKEASS
jgi:hypothetical protein